MRLPGDGVHVSTLKLEVAEAANISIINYRGVCEDGLACVHVFMHAYYKEAANSY